MGTRAPGCRLAAAALASAVVAGCALEVDYGAGRFACDSTADCPSGAVCAAGYCQAPPTGGADGPDAGGSAAADAALSGSSLVFLPVADAWVEVTEPAGNHGAGEHLRIDGEPRIASYVLFDFEELEDIEERVDIDSVALELYADSDHATGYRVSVVNGPTWSEGSLTFANAPAMSDPLGSSGPVTAGSWTSVDLAPVLAEGDFEHFALTTEDATELSLASRETGATAPRLVFTVAAP